jgi:ABC-type sugar transport system substrate-binding protein
MKKVVLLITVVLFLMSGMVFAQGQKEAADEGKIRVAVSLPPANNSWQAKLLDTVNEEIKKDADKFSFTVKNAVDDVDQLNQLQTF